MRTFSRFEQIQVESLDDLDLDASALGVSTTGLSADDSYKSFASTNRYLTERMRKQEVQEVETQNIYSSQEYLAYYFAFLMRVFILAVYQFNFKVFIYVYSCLFKREDKEGMLYRFFISGPQHDGVLPAKRFQYMFALGALLTCIFVWVTKDELIFGTDPMDDQYNINNHYPIHIAFNDVGCRVNGIPKPVLQGVTGEIRPGRVTGILGPSGAGKSVFTDMLLGRGKRYCSPSTGKVYLNGKERSLAAILDRVGFVPQFDSLFSELTVEETLLFSASWRLPRGTSEMEMKQALKETLETLNLNHIRDQRIGDVLHRGISGGEKKRVTIGMELIAKPSILIMDEPTSGLDSTAALKLMQTLREISDRGVSVIVSLHLPSTRVFNLLHDVILIKEGESVYVGPRINVLNYFHSLQFDIFSDDNIAENNKNKNFPIIRPAAPEFILDILAEVFKYPSDVCLNGKSCSTNTTLAGYWNKEKQWKTEWDSITKEMQLLIENEEDKRISNSTGDDSIYICDLYRTEARRWCLVLHGLGKILHFPRLSKPGLIQQTSIFVGVLVKLQMRRGFQYDIASIFAIGLTVAWMRSNSDTWEQRATNNYMMSIGISALGCFNAVFSDEPLPIARLADAGMILASFHLAVAWFTLIKGWLTCHLFSMFYHSFVYAFLGRSLIYPFSLFKYYQFTYIIHLNYQVSYHIGSLICFLTGHHFGSSYNVAIGVLMALHIFSLFSPNHRQVELDSFIMGNRYSIKGIVKAITSVSVVRYFLEAMMLWEPAKEGDDLVGRKFTLRYFGYEEENLSICCNTMFAIWILSSLTRYILFDHQNATDFHVLYDTPLFLIAVLKVIAAFTASLMMAMIAHEWPAMNLAWKEADELTKVKLLENYTSLKEDDEDYLNSGDEDEEDEQQQPVHYDSDEFTNSDAEEADYWSNILK